LPSATRPPSRASATASSSGTGRWASPLSRSSRARPESVEAITLEDLELLIGVGTAIKEGATTSTPCSAEEIAEAQAREKEEAAQSRG
jgi:hypothetical protein